MATIQEVLGVEKIYETVNSAKRLLAKLEDNPNWCNTFNQEIEEFKRTHNDTECVALQIAISSHVFLSCESEFLTLQFSEFFTLPISDDLLARRIGACDSNQKFTKANVVTPFSFRF